MNRFTCNIQDQGTHSFWFWILDSWSSCFLVVRVNVLSCPLSCISPHHNRISQLWFWSCSRWHRWRGWWNMPSWRVKHPGRRTCSLLTTGRRGAASPSTESTSPTAPASLWSWRTWLLSLNPKKRFLSLSSPVCASRWAQSMTKGDMKLTWKVVVVLLI